MRRSLFTLALALALACAVMAGVGGVHAAAVTLAVLLPLGLAALLVAHAVDGGRLRLHTLRQRFQVGLGIALGQLLAALAIGAASRSEEHAAELASSGHVVCRLL